MTKKSTKVGSLPCRKKSAIGAKNLQKLKSAVGKLGAINLYWVKNGVKYSFHRSTGWFDEFVDIVGRLESSEEREPSLEGRLQMSGLARASLPKSVKSKSPEELAGEMIEFGKKELGGLGFFIPREQIVLAEEGSLRLR